MYIDTATSLVATPANSTLTSVKAVTGSLSLQTDWVLAEYLTSQPILCVLFALAFRALAYPHLSLDRRTQLSGNYSLFRMKRHN